MKRKILCCLCMLSLSKGVCAIEPGPASAQQQETETWLQLQPRGTAASSIRQASTPAERDLSLQRWLDSYKDQIPDFYDQDKGGAISGSGGGR